MHPDSLTLVVEAPRYSRSPSVLIVTLLLSIPRTLCSPGDEASIARLKEVYVFSSLLSFVVTDTAGRPL